MGILDFWRDPRAVEGPALPEALGDEDAPFCSALDALAELASNSLRNWSLFIFVRTVYGRRVVKKYRRDVKSNGHYVPKYLGGLGG